MGVKQKKKEDNNIEEFDKIRKKYFEKKISRSEDCVTVTSAESPMVYEETKPDNAGFNAAARLQANQLSDFFDSSYWNKESFCCGFIFRGLLGEMMVDNRLIKRCPRHDPHNSHLPLTVQSLIESELRKLTEKKDEQRVAVKEAEKEAEKSEERSESDEGFCDKSSTVTGPASPDSLGFNIGLEDE